MTARWYDLEQTVNWRAGYAGHFGNDGTGRDRQSAVAARAIRDANRDMKGKAGAEAAVFTPRRHPAARRSTLGRWTP
jgi:hypothetical protein